MPNVISYSWRCAKCYNPCAAYKDLQGRTVLFPCTKLSCEFIYYFYKLFFKKYPYHLIPNGKVRAYPSTTVTPLKYRRI